MTCVSYFSSCRYKMLDKSNLRKKGGLVLVHTLEYRPSWWRKGSRGWQWDREVAAHIASAVGHGEISVGVQLAPSSLTFRSAGAPNHPWGGRFKVTLPS